MRTAVVIDMSTYRRLAHTVFLNDRIAAELAGLPSRRIHEAQARAARHVRNGMSEQLAIRVVVSWALSAGTDPFGGFAA